MNLSELYGKTRLEFKPDKSNKWQGYFGIELELERVRYNEGYTPWKNWSTHDDQSLRDSGVEFVTAIPMGGAMLIKAINEFYGNDMTYSAGPRTSTHIHLNMTDTTLAHLRTMLCVIYTIEDALFNVVGESRKWTGYAMPLSEMDPVRLRGMLQETDQRTLLGYLSPSRNAERYYGCNTAALARFGTMEFRYFPGGPKQAELESWIDLIHNLKENTKAWSVERFEGIESLSQFIDMILNVIGREWAVKLFAVTTAAQMFDKFVEVVAMAEGSSDVDRRERLVFLNPLLMTYVDTKLLDTDEQRKWFHEKLDSLRVVTQSDFTWYLRNARVQGMKTSKTDAMRISFADRIRAGTTEQYLNPFGEYAEPTDPFPEPVEADPFYDEDD